MKNAINLKSHTLVLIITLISNSFQAQLSGGITAGLSTGSVKIEEVGRGFNDVVSGKNITGYEAGFFLKYKAGSVYVKPMALYSFQQGEVTYQDQQMTYKSDKMAVPLLFGLNLLGPVSIEAGPVYNYVVDMTEQFNSDRFVTGKSGIGYRAGLSLNFRSLLVTAAYEGMNFPSTNSGQTQFSEPHKLVFGLALTLGGSCK